MSEFNTLLLSSLLQVTAFSLVPFIWWLTTARETDFFQWIGLKKPVINGSKVKIFLFIIVVVIVYIGAVSIIMATLLDDVTTAAGQFAGKGFAAIPSIIVYAVIQTSLSEELFFRGFLCKRLSARFGFVTGNLIQSVLFGLLHGVPFGLATGKWLVCALLTALPAAIGYVQGWLNEKKTNGSIIPSWIHHGLMNFLSAVFTI